MEHLARELARLAWQLQRDVEGLRDWANEANRSDRSDESDESIGSALGRIEARLGAKVGTEWIICDDLRALEAEVSQK
jgi:hypothetical protein